MATPATSIGREGRGTSPGGRQSSLLTPPALLLSAVGRSLSNSSHTSSTIRTDGPSRGSSRSPPPFLQTNLRATSDSPVYDNRSNLLTLGGLARRMPGHEATGLEVERNHLLRSVSHLNKDQTAPEMIIDRSDIFDHHVDTTTPFTRFDLLPPPIYEQKVRQPRKPSYGVRGGVRGRSYNDARRISYRSSTMTTPEYMESVGASNNYGFSHAYKGGTGKAKAMFPAAAAKLRKLSMSNIGGASRKLSTSADDGNIGSSSKDVSIKSSAFASTSASHTDQIAQDLANTAKEEELQMPSHINQTTSQDASNGSMDASTSQIRPVPSSSVDAPTRETADGKRDGLETDELHHDDDDDAFVTLSTNRAEKQSQSNAGPLSKSEIVNGNGPDTKSKLLFQSEKTDPNFKNLIIEQRPRQFNQVVPPLHTTITTISSEVQEARATPSRSAQDYDLRRSQDAVLAQSDAALISGASSAIAESTRIDSNTQQREGQTSSSALYTHRSFLDPARSSEFSSEASSSTHRRDSHYLPASASVDKDPVHPLTESKLDPLTYREEAAQESTAMSPAMMTTYNHPDSDIIVSRRGSAPVDSAGRRRSAFRFGMMKMNGSSIEINNLENDERGTHLEGNHRRQPSDDTTSNASSRGHRLSFSMTRPRQSQDSSRSGAFGLLSKLNRSRDQLPTTASSVDEVCDQNENSEKGSQKADAKLTTKQFILKAFRKPSLTPVALNTSNDSTLDANTTRPSALDSGSNSGSQDSVSTEATEHVFTAAFGTPQRSNSQSGRAFEGKEDVNARIDEGDLRRHARSGDGPTTRSSRDSSSTSFFSIAEGSQSRGAGTPLFDRSDSSTRDTGEQIFRTNSAMRSTAAIIGTPLREEGPLGETIGDETETMKETPSVESQSLHAAAADQALTAQHDDIESDGRAMLGQRSLGLDEEQSQTRASTSVPADASHSANIVNSGTNQGQSNGIRSTNTVPNRRPGLSSRLSHLPRLDSMRVIRRTDENASNHIGRDGISSGNDANASSETTQRHSDEHKSDTDTGDDTHEAADGMTSEAESEDMTDASGDESEADTSASRSSPTSQSQTLQNTSTAMPRPRPGDISMPPVPAFGSTDISQVASTSNATSPLAIATNQESWTQFDTAFTPFETPAITATPTLANSSAIAKSKETNSASTSGLANTRSPLGSSTYISQTPKGLSEMSNSYFDIRPASGSKGEVPPSPSVISRTRATSSVSKRSTLSPSREYPSLPPITPMQIRALEALTKGSNKSSAEPSGPSTSTALGASAVDQVASPASMPSRPVSIASPQDLISKSQGMPDRRAADMYSSAMPSSAIPSGSVKKRQNSNRPSLYQQQSRSLIDLNAITSRQLRDDYKPPPTPQSLHTSSHADESTMDSSHQSSTVQSPEGTLTPASSSAALRRRRSMFEVGAQPPPYAIIHKRPEGPQMIFPREEEGKESLPGYTCAVHIEGYLPRKMEFSSPGAQAKDRSWKRQYFVLHGTCLKVYKSDLSGENLMSKGAWGQVIEGAHVHTEPMNEDGPANVTSTSNKDNSATSNSARETSTNPNGHHHTQGGNSGLNAAVEKVNALTGSFHVGNRTGLVKTYSLQGAESGLAADYLKRRHVVRVRVEGEQFLLQTRNDRHVVDWIEAFQAATNVSLDLERRPMPKFITLPRRRRRRRRADGTIIGGAGAVAGGGSGGTSQEAMDLEEARRRSLFDANRNGGATSVSRSNSTRLPPARPLGLPGDESPDPSAAFDDMLREDQDDLMRREAADV